MAHLGKGVLHPGPRLGNALVAPLLALAQRLAWFRFALDVLAIPQGLEHLAALCAGVAPVGIDVGAGVVLVEHVIKVRAVVLAGRTCGDFADELVPGVHADAQLVAVVTLAVLLGVGGVQVFLPALGGIPLGRNAALFKLGLLLLGEVLDGSGHQGGVDDLPAPCQVAALQQLAVHRLKQRRDAIDAQALLVVPDGVAVGDAGAVLQQAKALVAHAIQQLVLHLLVAEVVEVLEDQNAHHHLGGVWRTPALGRVPPGQQFIDDLRQVVEVDVPGNDLQRITQRFDLGLARCIGKEVKLDGAAGLGLAHGVIVAWAGAVSDGGWGFLEVPHRVQL